MTDIIIQRHASPLAPISESLEKLKFGPWLDSASGRVGPFDFATTWVKADDFHPIAHDKENDISLIAVGRLFDKNDHVRLDHKLDEIIRDYRQRGEEALDIISGWGLLALIDGPKERCYLATDSMLFYPVYTAYADDPQKAAVSTHCDVVAAAYPTSFEYDHLAMTEFLLSGHAAIPHTYYKNIKTLHGGRLYRLDQDGLQIVRELWNFNPSVDESLTLEDVTQEFIDILKRATRRRLDSCKGKAGLLLSGGLDGRTVLFSQDRPSEDFVAITFCDEINQEVKLAQQLAQRAGIEQVILKRHFDFYGDQAIDTVRLSSGMWTMRDSHAYGFAEEIRKLGLNLILSGYYADAFFKGYYLDFYKTRTCPLVPLKAKLRDFHLEYEMPLARIDNQSLRSQAIERLMVPFEGLNLTNLSTLDRMKIELTRVRNISREINITFHTTICRMLPYDIINSDLEITKLLNKIPPRMKLNKNLCRKAVSMLGDKASGVPDSNSGLLVDATDLDWLLLRSRKKMTKLSKLLTGRLRKPTLLTDESWISWRYYVAHSSKIRELWEDVRSNSREPLTEMCGFDPFDIPLDVWADKHDDFGRMLTLGLWLNHRIK
jgi:asparagine synthetase B (glutamine-hydrolysing)